MELSAVQKEILIYMVKQFSKDNKVFLANGTGQTGHTCANKILHHTQERTQHGS